MRSNTVARRSVERSGFLKQGEVVDGALAMSRVAYRNSTLAFIVAGQCLAGVVSRSPGSLLGLPVVGFMVLRSRRLARRIDGGLPTDGIAAAFPLRSAIMAATDRRLLAIASTGKWSDRRRYVAFNVPWERIISTTRSKIFLTKLLTIRFDDGSVLVLSTSVLSVLGELDEGIRRHSPGRIHDRERRPTKIS